MAEEHIIKHSPFEVPKGSQKEEQDDSLAVRIGYGSKPDSSAKTIEPPAKASEIQKPAEREPDKASAALETKPIYEIQKLYSQVQSLQRQMMATCFEQQPDGSLKPKTGKIADGRGGMIEVEALQSAFIAQMSEKYETAVTTADAAMKNPELVIGATMACKKQLEASSEQTKTLQSELAKEGINPAVGSYLDTTLIRRYLEEHKELSPSQKEKVAALGESLLKQSQLEERYRDLRIMQETPIVSRQSYAEFLHSIGLPNAGNRWLEDAKKVSEQLNSPVGRSEFMKRQMDESVKLKNDSFDKRLQETYLKPQIELEKALQDAQTKATAGDLVGARRAMEEARILASKMPAIEKQDEESIARQADLLKKDREQLEQKLKDGTATPREVQLQREKEQKLVNEAQLLDLVRLAKPNTELAFAGFLLNVDKDKDSESNRKFARDILLNLRFDSLGKVAAAQSGEKFDQLMERALSGSVNNQATMLAFNKTMQEYDALKKKASEEKQDADIVKDFNLARSKAAEAATIAARVNRDAADGNQKIVIAQMQKQIDAEKLKPAAERDNGKIEILQAIVKPTREQSAREKELIAGLTECLKPEGESDKKKVDQLLSMLKDKSVLFDAVSAYSMIQQADFQKQALNNARLAMLDIDVAFDKGENNPLVKEIEGDKYGSELIATLNSVPGHDGRSQWGDIKEASRELGWGEKAWKWCKGTLKEVAISLVSWGAGILAGVGAAALFSWSGPGAVVGGAAVGFAAGAAVGSGIRALIGDKVTLTSAALDGISGMTGGVTGTSYALARGVGTAAVKNVIAQQAERGVAIGAGETWTAFKAAGMADKIRIAVGGSKFAASFTAATAGSIAYRFPNEALTGNYDNVGDWAKGSSWKVASDVPGNLIGSYFGAKFSGPKVAAMEALAVQNSGNFYNSAMRQAANNFLWTSPDGKNVFGGGRVPEARRSPFNAPVYDLLNGKEP
ncbi:MAG: hypothetical protein K2X27_09580 [Candidatus Obscuribacterales bacterium]|nr:hypothetical protein [Candidatus Obscuribacterales bacterium]